MKKAFVILSVLLALLIPVPVLADGDSSGDANLLYNGDFSIFAQSADLPAGWELDAYENTASAVYAHMGIDTDYGRCIVIENQSENDARVFQTLEIQPGCCYRITAMVCTYGVSGERGANLSIDNYSIDGTYCFSSDVIGTSGWQAVTMLVRAGASQTQMRVAMRLGGYGSTASGEAWFTGIYAEEITDPGTADVIDLPTENGEAGTGSTGNVAIPQSEQSIFFLILAVTVAGALLFAFAYSSRWQHGAALIRQPEQTRGSLIELLILAFVIRVMLSILFVGHATDLGCFMAWGNAVLSDGMQNFYTSGMFADYPPGYMYIVGVLAWIGRLLGLTYGSTGYVLLFKLPATIAELVSAYLVYRLAVKNQIGARFAIALSAIFVLSPVLMFVSGAWGQIDSILTLLIVASFFLLQGDKKILAGAVYGLAILMKPQALMFGPLLAVAYFADVPGKGWAKRLCRTVLAVLAAFGVLFLLSLPFKGDQPWYWLAQKYYDTAGSYAYASIEAFNMPSLIGGNWAKVSTTVLGVSYLIWGSLFIGLAVLSGGALYVYGRKESRGCLFLTGAFMIAMIFTFGHYMHERYLLPALLLLLIAYVFYRDKRILVSFGWLSFAALLNVLAAMYIVNHQSARGTLYDGITFFGSLLEVTGFLYLAYVAFDVIVRRRIKAPDPKKLEEKTAAQERNSAPINPVSLDQGRLRYTKKEYVLLFSLIFVYGIFALTNLGALQSPETFWESDAVGDTVLIEFADTVQVSEYWVHGNIRNGGTLLLTTDDGHEETFEQLYDDMFRWKAISTDFHTSHVELMLYAGDVCINEIAFFDADGTLLIPTYVSENGAALFDEQDTVPDEPLAFNGMYFDELYHGRTAYEHLHTLSPYENSHPPLGKILISIGVAIFGMTPFGWRIVGALFGIGMLPVLYALARRIFKNTDYAFVATALFAFDFMHFTQTRIATIDVYAVFFILVMYYFMFRYISMNFFCDGLSKTLLPLGLCGVFFGIGAACKWTCFYAGGGLAVLFFYSLYTRFREYRGMMVSGTQAQKAQVGQFGTKTIQTLLFCCVFFLLIPFVIYFLSYMPYYVYEASAASMDGSQYRIVDAARTFFHYQEFMYNYHSGLDATHAYQSAWYQWPFTAKPMWYYFTSFDGKLATLTASGNPAVWWISSIGAVILLMLRLGKRIPPDRALQLICIGVLANYLPWVLVSRCTFIYHFFATVPFLVLACVYLLQKFEKREPLAAWLKWFWLGLAVLLFVLLYPGLSGYPVSAEWAAILKNLPGGGLMYGA